MALRDALPPVWLAAVAALAGLVTGVLVPRGTSPPAPAPSPASPPRAFAIPGAPPAGIAAAMGEAIPAAFGPGRTDEGFTRVKALAAEWASASPRDPLASAAWWRAALRRALPEGAGLPRGLFRTTFTFLGTESPLQFSVPPGPGPFPAVLVLLDGGEIPALHGDLLGTHVVIGLPVDDALAGDPRIALVALSDAMGRYPVDPDRVVLDGTGRGAAVAAELAPDAARQLACAVLRGVPAPAAAILGLLAVRGDGPPAEVAAWIAAVPLRASADPRRPVAWTSVTGDRYRSWGPGFVVRRLRSNVPGREVSVRMSRDPAANAVVLETENVAEILLLLTDEGLDLDRPVKVVAGGAVVHEKPVPRSLDAVRAWSSQGEPALFVAAELSVRIPE